MFRSELWGQCKIVFEVIVFNLLSRWFCVVDQNLIVISCVHYSVSFGKILHTTGWNAALNHEEPPPCFTDGSRHSLLDRFSDLLYTYWQWFQPQSSTLEDLFSLQHTLAFSPPFCFVKNGFSTPTHGSIDTIFNEASLNSGWISWWARCIFCIRSLLDLFIFLKDMIFGYCSCALDHFLGLPLLPSSFFKGTLHTMVRYATFYLNSSMLITF